MEPITVFLLSMLMALANAGVLGLMRRDFPAALRPAADTWRVSTLLHACGSLLFVVQDLLPIGVVLPLGNGLVILGLTGYWRALRQFYGQPDRVWLLAPTVVCALVVFWFAALQPNPDARLLIVTGIWLTTLGGSVYTLARQGRRDHAMSRRVLCGIFVFVMAFVLLRAAYLLAVGRPAHFSPADAGGWLNVVTPMLMALLPVIGTTAFLLLCSERIRRQWERAASTDYLTGLANRRTLADAGALRFAAAVRRDEGFGLALIDIDHFKAINDNHGHDIGDVALKHLAAVLVGACRDAELPARQGGEEFVVLFQNIDPEQAHKAGERLRRAVAAAPFVAGDLSLAMTVSVGVAVRCAEDGDFDALLRRADAALYRAKAAGRDRVEVAPPPGP
jgi:diguanylate cyclase (GGDEF)-like protein